MDFVLRTQQIQYLEYLAERADISISEAFGRVIERSLEAIRIEASQPAQKIRKHLTVEHAHIAFIDSLAIKWGLPRSDVARRVIDMALAEDQTV